MSLSRKRIAWVSMGLFVICLTIFIITYKYIYNDEITRVELEQILGLPIPNGDRFLYRKCSHSSGLIETMSNDQVLITEQLIMASTTLLDAEHMAQDLGLYLISDINNFSLSPITCNLDWWENDKFEFAYIWDEFQESSPHNNLSGCRYVVLAYKENNAFIYIDVWGNIRDNTKCGGLP